MLPPSRHPVDQTLRKNSSGPSQSRSPLDGTQDDSQPKAAASHAATAGAAASPRHQARHRDSREGLSIHAFKGRMHGLFPLHVIGVLGLVLIDTAAPTVLDL